MRTLGVKASAVMLCGEAQLGGFDHFTGSVRRRSLLGLLWVCLIPDSDFRGERTKSLKTSWEGGEGLHFSLPTQCVTLTPHHHALAEHSCGTINGFKGANFTDWLVVRKL